MQVESKFTKSRGAGLVSTQNPLKDTTAQLRYMFAIPISAVVYAGALYAGAFD